MEPLPSYDLRQENPRIIGVTGDDYCGFCGTLEWPV
jgi:hypothetical protein